MGAALLDGLIIWGIVLVVMFVAAMVSLMAGISLDRPLSLLLTLGTAAAYSIGTMTRIGEHNGLALDSFRFETLDQLYEMAARVPLGSIR